MNKINHVAIIMDGNGRWAKKRHLPRKAGHIAGVKSTQKAIEFAVKNQIKSLTLYAFSNENWSRPKEETDHLMLLFVSSLKKEIKTLHKNNIRVRFIGVKEELPEKVQNEIKASEKLTQNNSGLNLNIAFNYGGRSEIIEAIKKLLADDINVQNLDEQQLTKYLDFPDQQDVDLLIRTGGEQRVSNFLLWHIAYAELYFTDTFWPDFKENNFQLALDNYHKKERRFGKISEQCK